MHIPVVSGHLPCVFYRRSDEAPHESSCKSQLPVTAAVIVETENENHCSHAVKRKEILIFGQECKMGLLSGKLSKRDSSGNLARKENLQEKLFSLVLSYFCFGMELDISSAENKHERVEGKRSQLP